MLFLDLEVSCVLWGLEEKGKGKGKDKDKDEDDEEEEDAMVNGNVLEGCDWLWRQSFDDRGYMFALVASVWDYEGRVESMRIIMCIYKLIGIVASEEEKLVIQDKSCISTLKDLAIL